MWMFLRHKGHVSLTLSHLTMQLRWKACEQICGMRSIAFDPSRSTSRHMLQHSDSSSSSSPSSWFTSKESWLLIIGCVGLLTPKTLLPTLILFSITIESYTKQPSIILLCIPWFTTIFIPLQLVVVDIILNYSKEIMIERVWWVNV